MRYILFLLFLLLYTVRAVLEHNSMLAAATLSPYVTIAYVLLCLYFSYKLYGSPYFFFPVVIAGAKIIHYFAWLPVTYGYMLQVIYSLAYFATGILLILQGIQGRRNDQLRSSGIMLLTGSICLLFILKLVPLISMKEYPVLDFISGSALIHFALITACLSSFAVNSFRTVHRREGSLLLFIAILSMLPIIGALVG